MDQYNNMISDRVITSIQPPPLNPLDKSELYPNGTDMPPDWKLLRKHFQAEGTLKKEHCIQIIRQFTSYTSIEPNIIVMDDPVNIVGDIHGQYYDLLKLLEIGAEPATENKYLFLGDYVDRGSFSIEVMLLLMALKINYPTDVYLLRGNHECRQMTTFFNFRDECLRKYDLTLYKNFIDAFDSLPLCGLINNRIFAVHGGISPQLKKKESVMALNRYQEPPRVGLFCDLLWADPLNEERYSYMSENEQYLPNDVRGCSYYYGFNAVKEFLEENKLLTIVRAHEAQLDGYKMYKNHPVTNFPTVITIFSAPNYCDIYNNKGAILKFKNNTIDIQQFHYSVHPYVLPNFLDLFEWCIPFIAIKFSEIFESIVLGDVDTIINDLRDEDLEICKTFIKSDKDEIIKSLMPDNNLIKAEVARSIQNKVNILNILFKMVFILREKKKEIDFIKVYNDNQLPYGLLIGGAKKLDKGKQKMHI